MNNESLTIRCDCNSVEHIAVLDYIKLDTEKEVFLNIHLSILPWYKRVLYGIKYIFGYQHSTGAFSEIVINEKQLMNIVDFLVEVQND